MVLTREISSSCESRNSPECARCILNLVRRQLMQAGESTPPSNGDREILRRLKEVFAQLGAVVVSSEGQVQFITRRGERLLGQYFPSHAPPSWPEPIRRWFEEHVPSLTAEGPVPLPCLPLQVQQAARQLLVRPMAELSPGQYLFLLEEEKLPSFSIATLELLGITRREAEVLFWVARDKCNAGIARVLGCSKRTVKTHLEHIYKKLGVQTRTAALMVALSRLGLLKGQFVAISESSQ